MTKTAARTCIALALHLSASAVFLTLEPINAALATTSCSASLPARLESEFSREQLLLLAQILPQATAVRLSDRPVARAELRAPVHISCQLQQFPHIRAFIELEIDKTIANLEIKPFAQPPHLVFFDVNHQVVRTEPVAPSWTPYELRDRIVTTMAGKK